MRGRTICPATPARPTSASIPPAGSQLSTSPRPPTGLPQQPARPPIRRRPVRQRGSRQIASHALPAACPARTRRSVFVVILSLNFFIDQPLFDPYDEKDMGAAVRLASHRWPARPQVLMRRIGTGGDDDNGCRMRAVSRVREDLMRASRARRCVAPRRPGDNKGQQAGHACRGGEE